MSVSAGDASQISASEISIVGNVPRDNIRYLIKIIFKLKIRKLPNKSLMSYEELIFEIVKERKNGSGLLLLNMPVSEHLHVYAICSEVTGKAPDGIRARNPIYRHSSRMDWSFIGPI